MSKDVKQKSLTAPDLRAKRVARTEAQLIEAASVLFCDQGYVATTLAQIAERAGVAARTVYVRFGTKAALFRRVIDQALVADAEPVDVAHRPRVRDAMTAATLAERIEALADVSAGIAERAGALFEVAAQSEGLEPELAEAAQAGRHSTTQLCRSFWDQAAADGHLAEGLNPEHLTVVTDVLLCADTIVHIRRTHGWSAALHRSLIVETLTALTRRRA
ncbi:helix-turn-helix domain-containing protein [Pseudarthrobacter sp. IC2-21]|uniref:TetR/AcrR family transcriptional regulator n=1 Tax=Pseudarthrobacter sp. IC2-21 TaxID=3092262 RepID=UPI002A6A83BF|nr:helix-turn-helix domain-containing protein [Pseudarthrobacter sp. IC2-21]